MDKKTYDFAKLQKDYGDFLAPECEVQIGTLKLADIEYSIETCQVDQAADGSAGGCKIELFDIYDYAKSSFDSKIMNALTVGAKLTVKMGYSKKSEVFVGYVDEFTIDYAEEESPHITIMGLDGLGFLMNVRSRLFAGEKKIGEIVKQLLNDSVSAGAASKVTVGSKLKDMTVQRIFEGQDSFTFLNTVAKQTGMQMLCINGEIIFDDVRATTAPVITLDTSDGLYTFSKRFSVANQPSKVIVHGRDINNQPIKGEVTSTQLSGSGKDAASVASKLLKKAVYEEESPLAMTADECKTLAQNRFDDLAEEYVTGNGECVGLPEITAGRYIKLKGLDSKTDDAYFLTRVSHILNDEGYSIKFETKGGKSK